MSVTVLACLALMLNALVWGVSWWPFRELQSMGLHPLWSTALIYGLAMAGLLLWRPGTLRHLLAHPGLWVLLLAAGATNVGFNWAVTLGDVVRVILLFYLMPAWAVLLAWALLGERPAPVALLRLVLALAGVLVMLKTPDVEWPLPHTLADALAIAGGFAFALTNVMLRRLAATPETGRILAMFAGGALLPAGVATLAGLTGAIAVPWPPSPQWAWVGLGLALAVLFLLGNLGLQYGAARLSASTTALVMLSEIVFAGVSSVALGAAELSWRTVVGGGLILSAAAWAALGSNPGPTAAPASRPD